MNLERKNTLLNRARKWIPICQTNIAKPTMLYFTLPRIFQRTFNAIDCMFDSSEKKQDSLICQSFLHFYKKLLSQAQDREEESNGSHNYTELLNTFPLPTRSFKAIYIGIQKDCKLIESFNRSPGDIHLIINFNEDNSNQKESMWLKRNNNISTENYSCKNSDAFINLQIKNSNLYEITVVQSCTDPVELFARISMALVSQKQGGTLYIELQEKADIVFNERTSSLFYILCSMYEKVYIGKLLDCKETCDRHIVCSDFLFANAQEYSLYLLRAIIKAELSGTAPTRWISHPLPCFFMTRLEENHLIFAQQQMENVHSSIIKKKEKHALVERHEDIN